MRVLVSAYPFLNQVAARDGIEFVYHPWNRKPKPEQILEEVVRGECPVIGGLYVEQYVSGPDRAFDPAQFTRAMGAALENSDGLMLFDLVHIANFEAWDVVADFLAAARPTSAVAETSD